jgi:RND family efflux transporter MFP subunit
MEPLMVLPFRRNLPMLGALLTWGASLGPLPATGADMLNQQQLDCLIEPRVTIKLGAAVSGLITSVVVDRGDVIKTGQIIAALESDVEEANVALARAKAANDLQVLSNQARLEFLRSKFSRQEKLKVTNSVTAATFEEAETDAKMADFATKEAELNLGVARLELNHQEKLLKQRTIRSPIDGVVVERALFAGEYTHETNHILTIAQLDPLNIEVFVPIAYHGQIKIGDQAEIYPESPVSGRYQGTVTVADRVVDASSGTFGVRLELPNPDYLLPAGISCKIHFGEMLDTAPSAGGANGRRIAPNGTLTDGQTQAPATPDPTTTEAIKLPSSQPSPEMALTTAPPATNQILATTPVATPSLPSTDGELYEIPPATPLMATAADNGPPPTSAVTTLLPTVSHNEVSPNIPAAAIVPSATDKTPLPIPRAVPYVHRVRHEISTPRRRIRAEEAPAAGSQPRM